MELLQKMGIVEKKHQQVLYLNKSVSSSLKRLSIRYDISISKLAEIILRDGIEDLRKNGVGRLKID